MKRSLIKVAAVATILALGGLGLAYDALAWGRFDGRHFGHGAWFTGKFHDNLIEPCHCAPHGSEININSRLYQ